jgi:hypothetical protein
VPGPLPDQLLVCSGYHLDRLGLVGVASDRAQLVSIGTHHVSQRVRIRSIAFRAGDAAPFPVAGHLQRVDRIHLVAGGDQRRHPRTPVGLDPDHHLLGPLVLTELLRDQLVQPGDPRDPLGQPGTAQPPTGLILDLHIMMRL